MGIVDEIKKGAEKNNTKIQDSQSAAFEKILNKMFYLEKDIDEEVAFVKMVMTRGLESQKRVGLHASALIVSDNKFCYREQVLSLLFERIQNENISVGLKRIFEEGNAIHEKWQRLFIRAGYGKAKTMDRTRMCNLYKISYTPDIVCKMPEYFDGAMVGEIKSVNTFQFKKMTSHPSAKKQLQFYMFLCIMEAKRKGTWNGKDYTKGFVLCDDKNTQDFKCFIYDYDPEFVEPFKERAEKTMRYLMKYVEHGKLVKRCDQCTSSKCKRAEECAMKNACWETGFGRVKLK